MKSSKTRPLPNIINQKATYVGTFSRLKAQFRWILEVICSKADSDLQT